MKISHYTEQEGGEWLPWIGGDVDGRTLPKERMMPTANIKGTIVHAIRDISGRIWDSFNGWRDKPAASSEEKSEPPVDDGAAEPSADSDADKSAAPDPAAQAYAERVWSGQTPDLPRNVRLARVQAALEGQGLSMEGVVL